MTDEKNLPSEELNTLAAFIRDLGYKANPAGERHIETAMSGFSTLVFYFGDSVQMYTGFNPDDDTFGFDEVNKFNEGYRFAKCYLRKGIRFEGDFFFEISGQNSMDDLKKIFRSWEVTLNLASQSMTAARKALEDTKAHEETPKVLGN